MKEFFLVLFFSKTILLTPDPINLAGEIELSPDAPLKAITSGASLQIDISNVAKGISIKDTGIIESRELIQKLIPKGSVSAVLHSRKKEVPLEDSGVAVSNDGAMLVLTSKTGIPLDLQFDKIKIISRIELNDVKIYWKNFKH